MRVAYICADPGVPVFGRKGCSIHVREVIAAMQAQGARVDLFACRLEGPPPAGWPAVRVHALPPLSASDPAARERAAIQNNALLAAALEKSGPFDMVYERYSLWSHAAIEWARAQGIPGLLEVNAPLIDEQAAHRTLVDRGSAERIAGRVFGTASAILAVSPEVAAYLRRWPGVEPRLHVVPNGVNPDRFPIGLAPTRPAPGGGLTVGFVGTLKPWHGLSILADAFAHVHRVVPGSRLLIVGDGPEREEFAGHLQTLGLAQAADLVGAVAAEDVPGLLASMDIAVAPYPDLPQFYFAPLKIYEYMAAGLPVVASRIGMLTRLIQHGRNGLLVTPGDAAGLAQTLVRLARDAVLRSRLGERARADVLRSCTWGHVVGRIFHLAGLAPREPVLVEASA